MIKSAEFPIFLLESNGERRPFDPVELQDALVRAFLGAGLRENCYLAEDIALAVEYAFDHSSRPGKVFSRAELNSAVVHILEDTGLADVAALFRQGAPGMLAVDCRTDRMTVGTVLAKFMTGSEAHLAFLTDKVTQAAATLRIESAAPSLLVELARYFETAAPPPTMLAPVLAGSEDDFYSVEPDAVEPALAADTRELVRRGIIRLHGVSRLFPSVRLFCFLRRFAAERSAIEQWQGPVTEMALAPLLFQLGDALERCRAATVQLYRETMGDPNAVLPVYLSIPDMSEFAEEYLEASHGKSEKLERELAQMLIEPMTVRIEKLQLGSVR